jgi:DNA-binding transcriptional MerR regulator/methylmalonyl-CoA mutase cobalamin-binding subunit
MAQPSQPIAVVAKITGVSTDTIRAWERRYRLVRPERGERGARRYSERDVRRIALAQRATRLGHPIGSIARLSDLELERLIRQHEDAHPAPPAEPAEDGATVERAYRSLADLDLPAASAQLCSAALLLEPQEFVLGLLAPLMRRIGEGWRAGEIGIAVEHAASNLVRDVIATFCRTRTTLSGTTVLFATPPNELHDLGACLAACLVAAHGMRAVLLGAQVPAEEVVLAAKRVGARAVVISATSQMLADAWESYVRVLDVHLPPPMALWVGGAGAERLRALSARIARLPTLEAFARHLEMQKPLWPA